MRIRVMHIVEALGVGGGVEHGLANLIERMDPEKFEHIVCSVFRMGPRLERYPETRVRVICLGEKAKLQVRPLARVFREFKPAIVHSRNWGTLDAVIAGRWVRSCAVVHSEHGVEADPSAEPLRRICLRRVAFELAHRVFSVSYQLRNVLARHTGFPQRKIGVIHNGVDQRRFQVDHSVRREIRQELGLGENEFCIGCVGRLHPIKDYPTMLRAAEIFGRASDSDWRLLIAGGGPELTALKELVAATPVLDGRVGFLGPQPRIPEFLASLDAYVLPSLWEGISNSLLEAMATGLPVLASDTGGNPEVVQDGESGLLFPVGNAPRLAEQLLSLRNNVEKRAQLGRNALARIQQEFSLDAMVRQYDQMYSSLAGYQAA